MVDCITSYAWVLRAKEDWYTFKADNLNLPLTANSFLLEWKELDIQ